MMHIVIQITDAMTALTILYLVSMMATKDLKSRLSSGNNATTDVYTLEAILS